MNLFDLSNTEQSPTGVIQTKQGGWVGTLPDGYTTMVDGKKFTVRNHPREGQSLIHELPGGGEINIQRDGSISWHNDRGELHREDGPAAMYADGIEMWMHDGKFHREDGPAAIFSDGTEAWYHNGKLHREDGPASTWRGEVCWYRHGQRHREDGPAITRPDGSTEWWVDGRRHREDGPAVIHTDGTEEYWLHGEQVNKEDLP